jgi:deoxyadenosine/deoxycytidine kinase
MKKNIIISGTARAGKSTLCSMLSKELGYQHVSMDAIIEGFEDVFPELGIDTHTDNIMNISKKISPFINAILKSGEYDKFDYGMVIDVSQLMPEDFVRHIDNSVCDIYYLITDWDTVEERLKVLEQYDTEKEYTYSKTLEKKMRICQGIIDESKVYKKQCNIYNIPCTDTLYERDKKLAELFNRIKSS